MRKPRNPECAGRAAHGRSGKRNAAADPNPAARQRYRF